MGKNVHLNDSSNSFLRWGKERERETELFERLNRMSQISNRTIWWGEKCATLERNADESVLRLHYEGVRGVLIKFTCKDQVGFHCRGGDISILSVSSNNNNNKIKKTDKAEVSIYAKIFHYRKKLPRPCHRLPQLQRAATVRLYFAGNAKTHYILHASSGCL